MPDASEKGPALLLETVFVFVFPLILFLVFFFFGAESLVLLIAAASAIHAEGRVVIQQDRQIRLQISADQLMKLKNGLGA